MVSAKPHTKYMYTQTRFVYIFQNMEAIIGILFSCSQGVVQLTNKDS